MDSAMSFFLAYPASQVISKRASWYRGIIHCMPETPRPLALIAITYQIALNYCRTIIVTINGTPMPDPQPRSPADHSSRPPYRFSLIVATVDRTDVLQKLLQSIAIQQRNDFEVIVVDQNDDDRLLPILAAYESHFPIQHLKLNQRSVSNARNAGIAVATGEVLGFPDDDAWMPQGMLERIDHKLKDMTSNNAAKNAAANAGCGLVIRCLDEQGKPTASDTPEQSGKVTRHNAHRYGVCSMLYLPRTAVQSIGGFDKHMGWGAPTPYQIAEDVDLLVRVLGQGCNVWYDATTHILHPPRHAGNDANWQNRIHQQSRSVSYLLKKNRYPLWYQAAYRILGAARLLTAFLPWSNVSVKVAWADLRGRLQG